MLLVACLPVVTVPMALQAATVALERWRVSGEDRVVQEFLAALRSRPPLRTTVTVGTPLAVAVIAAEEVHFFSRGGSPGDWVSLGFGVAALLVALASIGYVLVLGARRAPHGTERPLEPVGLPGSAEPADDRPVVRRRVRGDGFAAPARPGARADRGADPASPVPEAHSPASASAGSREVRRGRVLPSCCRRNMRRADENRYRDMGYRRCGAKGLLLPAISLGLWRPR